MHTQLSLWFPAVACILVAVLHGCFGCSPKAVKSVISGRATAQAQHEAKKAKYLAGETRTVGQKLRLSKGGVPMEQIGVTRLRSEIKYLESVEKVLKKQTKLDKKLEKAIAKSQATGKPLSGSAKKLQAKKLALDKASDEARGVQAAAAAGAAGSKAAKVKGGGKGVSDAADSLADAGKASKDLSKGGKAAADAVQEAGSAVKPVNMKQFKGKSVTELADQMKSAQTRLDDASKALKEATEAHAKAVEIASKSKGLAKIASKQTNKQRIQMALEKMGAAKRQVDDAASALAGVTAAHSAKLSKGGGKVKGAMVEAAESADKAAKAVHRLLPWKKSR